MTGWGNPDDAEFQRMLHRQRMDAYNSLYRASLESMRSENSNQELLLLLGEEE